MAISILSPVFILSQLIPAGFAILAGVFLILTEKYDENEIMHVKFFVYAGALLIISRIAVLILIIFQIQLITGASMVTIGYNYLALAFIQDFPMLIIFVVSFSYIGIHNKEQIGNYLLYTSFIGTLYSILLIIRDLSVFYWILGYIPIEVAIIIGLIALIIAFITFILLIIVGIKTINKYFAIAGFCFLCRDFLISFILFLLI